jgi:hypothetical protein
MWRMCGRKVTRLTLRDLRRCLGDLFTLASSLERGGDVTAEVSRGHVKFRKPSMLLILIDIFLTTEMLQRKSNGIPMLHCANDVVC